ncbi:response regulator transcription factor [Schumannella luteola]|nr:response regulator transcription factor [Schumannella luteola]
MTAPAASTPPAASAPPASSAVRVLLVDDQELVRTGFRAILSAQPGVEVIGEAGDGIAAVSAAAELDPDVICMDVQMPGIDGLEATRRIVDAGSRAAILVLTTFDSDDYLFRALAAGASGFLLKTARPEHLAEAVRVLAAGDALLSPEVTRRVIERFGAGVRAGGADAAGGRFGAGAAELAGSGAAGPGAVGPDAVAPGDGREATRPSAGPDADAHAGADAPRASTVLPPEAALLTEREAEVLGHVARGLSNAEIAAELVVGEATVKTHVSNVLLKLRVRDRVQAVVWAYDSGFVAPSA